MLAVLALAVQVATGVNDALLWEYEDQHAASFGITEFLVCLDGQATAACVKVPVSAGVPSTTAPEKVYTWKLPPLSAGPHKATVQACTAGAAACSSGVPLSFTVQLVIANPKNLRLGSGR